MEFHSYHLISLWNDTWKGIRTPKGPEQKWHLLKGFPFLLMHTTPDSVNHPHTRSPGTAQQLRTSGPRCHGSWGVGRTRSSPRAPGTQTALAAETCKLLPLGPGASSVCAHTGLDLHLSSLGKVFERLEKCPWNTSGQTFTKKKNFHCLVRISKYTYPLNETTEHNSNSQGFENQKRWMLKATSPKIIFCSSSGTRIAAWDI